MKGCVKLCLLVDFDVKIWLGCEGKFNGKEGKKKWKGKLDNSMFVVILLVFWIIWRYKLRSVLIGIFFFLINSR